MMVYTLFQKMHVYFVSLLKKTETTLSIMERHDLIQRLSLTNLTEEQGEQK